MGKDGTITVEESQTLDHLITIAMDIDDLLTSMEITSLRSRSWLDPVHHRKEHFFTVEFKHDGDVHKVDNVLVPGCVELFRFLFERADVRPAFFSAGIRARNLALGRRVVQMAVDGGGDPAWLNRYAVYSREDCFDTERLAHYLDDEVRKRFQPPLFFGNYKKDLRMIHHGREAYHAMHLQTLHEPAVLLPDPEQDEKLLENLVLVEEDASYLFPGQEKNMLLCPTYGHAGPFMVNYHGEDTPSECKTSYRNDFKCANTIFYAAGVLSRAFERHEAEGLPIPEILWQEQGHLWANRDAYDKRFPVEFFTKGREVLRRYNPDLNFAVASNTQG